MSVQVDQVALAQAGQVEVNIHLQASIHITARMAQRRASRLVISEIGNLLYGGEPSLVIGERVCWRVPIILAYPDTGPTGQVGVLDVDVETGAVLTTPEQSTEIAQYAHDLALRTAAAVK